MQHRDRSALRALRHSLVLALVVPLALIALAPPSIAQKVARDETELPAHGFKVKGLDRFDGVPVDSRSSGGQVLKFRDDGNWFDAYAFYDPELEGKRKKGESVAKKRRKDIVGYLKSRLKGFDKALKEAVLDEEVEINGVDARHRRFIREQSKGDWTVDIWSFPLKHADVHLVYIITDEFDRRWEKATSDSAQSFEEIERVEQVEVDTGQRTFADQLAWAEQEAAKTEGWQAIGTPSERFVILTNADKKAFIKEVVKRLEVSRDLYEKDFPPPDNFKAVSVVRICKDREEFQRFSGTGGGVAGYFSPSTVELVLYDAVNLNRNSTYAVVSHEAFHQYCHFLFNQSEAHRWFDEGHGDYYGGMKISGSRGKITPKMPAGLDRLSVIRQMVRENRTVPLQDHLNYTHSQWQAHGVPSYAQSWSIVYMLRQGALRKVNRKVWKDEYADIIPNYVRTLNDGFEAAYEEIREERRKKAKGRELTPEELEVNRFHLDPRQKKKIWEAAMEASWGQIDLDEFEEHWKLYIEKYLK